MPFEDQDVYYYRRELLHTKHWCSPPEASKALLYAGGMLPLPDLQLTVLAQGRVLGHTEVQSSCLVQARLPALSSFFPATKALKGCSIVFKVAGEIPAGEQQTLPRAHDGVHFRPRAWCECGFQQGLLRIQSYNSARVLPQEGFQIQSSLEYR